MLQNIERHMRRPAVESVTGLARSTIYKLMSDGLFPKPVKLSTRAVGWRESDIAQWLASRKVAQK